MFGGTKSFDFKRATVFCLGHRLSKHIMTRYASNLGGWPTPGYAFTKYITCSLRYEEVTQSSTIWRLINFALQTTAENLVVSQKPSVFRCYAVRKGFCVA